MNDDSLHYTAYCIEAYIYMLKPPYSAAEILECGSQQDHEKICDQLCGILREYSDSLTFNDVHAVSNKKSYAYNVVGHRKVYIKRPLPAASLLTFVSRNTSAVMVCNSHFLVDKRFEVSGV